MNDFNALTSIDIRQCANSPSDTKPPPLFPILRSLTSFLVDGVKWKWYAQCPAPAIINPCTCVVVPGDDVCSITCPPGSDIVNIENVFTAMLKNSILGDVTINFPPGTNTAIPSMLLASNPARTINLIGPEGTPPILTVILLLKININCSHVFLFYRLIPMLLLLHLVQTLDSQFKSLI